jgi:hypothetical protein
MPYVLPAYIVSVKCVLRGSSDLNSKADNVPDNVPDNVIVAQDHIPPGSSPSMVSKSGRTCVQNPRAP